MKRKKFTINSGDDSSPIRSAFPRGFHGVRSSKTRLNTAACRETQADNPKTSEYSFFKKFKEDAGHRFHKPSLHQAQNSCSIFKASDSSCREGGNIIENSHKELKFSLRPKNVPPSDNFVSFPSPPVNASKKSVIDMRKVDSSLADLHGSHENMEEYGSPCKNADIFSRKRQKLRQLVADISFPEVDELCAKGYDFVSALLSKLLPESNEEKSFELLKMGKLETDIKSRSLPPLKSEMRYKKSHWTPTSNYVELEHGQTLDVDFSSCFLELPEEKELPNPNSQSHHSHRTYLDTTNMELNYDSAFHFHNKKHGSLTSRHLKELAEFHYPIEPLLGGKPCTLLLGWDFDDMTDKSNLSIHCQNAELSLLPILSSSHGEVQKQNLDSGFIASGLGTPSLFPYHPSNLPLLQCSPSVSNRSHTLGERSLEVKDDVLSVLNDFSLSLPLTENHLNLSGYSYCNTACQGGSILFSPQSNLWVMRRLLNDEHHCPGTENCFSTGKDFYLEPECIPVSDFWRNHYSHTCHALEFPQNEGMSSYFLTWDNNEKYLDGLSRRENINHFSEDKVNVHDLSSIYFQMSVDKEKACPLLLGKSQWYDSKAEMYFDDNEVKF
ncbi:uncharacterized protein LOC8262787 isoform X2 [Ricinus communis]|uniref:uncharacterized protein LOC8262787 isoform X2 n=1 Tax=Ricinus communis TaxID=3988 RepID=UPI00201B26F2|nr:uncharacterized protein LOC8262787 isoform X2 [Ricinus communis]